MTGRKGAALAEDPVADVRAGYKRAEFAEDPVADVRAGYKRAEFAEDLVADVRADYERRAAARRQFEAQWQLNANFVLGNQYAYVNVKGEVADSEREYFWQEREVFNHVASIVEARLAKLSRIRPRPGVMPASGDDNDLKTAKTATKILGSAYNRLEIDHLLSRGSMWSELTGSVFYKVGWDKNAGRKVGRSGGETVREGDVRIDVCPPYEILPDSLSAQSVAECASIIHAKAVHVADIKRIWGADVRPDAPLSPDLSGVGFSGGLGLISALPAVGSVTGEGHALVLERYSLPAPGKPEGALVIAAGDKLLYAGPLPYVNGEDGERVLPFVQQNAIEHAGCFYGISMVERAIPVQRAYNAVKNRKHEFLNRIAMGVLAVEDGSVDTENLEEEGLSPGKILVYRQGSTPPRFFNPGSVPAEFSIEEQRLLNEFIDISGISEIMRSSTVPASVTSGVAIQLLIDQDDTRISVAADSVKRAVKQLARHILRLYRQFAGLPRLSRFVGEAGEIELLSWNKNDIGSDDVYFEAAGDVSQTAAAKQAVMFDLLKAGLLHDENGRLDDAARHKILETFGYGAWEQTQNVKALHVKRAERENLAVARAPIEVSELDDHDLHVAAHTRHALSAEFLEAEKKDAALRERLLVHIRTHKQYQRTEAEIEKGEPEGETDA